MEEVCMQYWEESERNWGIRPDGCSLHFNGKICKEYINEIYKDRDKENVPDVYDKTVGEIILVKVKKELYELVVKDDTVRLSQNEMNNLVKLGELLLC